MYPLSTYAQAAERLPLRTFGLNTDAPGRSRTSDPLLRRQRQVPTGSHVQASLHGLSMRQAARTGSAQTRLLKDLKGSKTEPRVPAVYPTAKTSAPEAPAWGGAYAEVEARPRGELRSHEAPRSPRQPEVGRESSGELVIPLALRGAG